MTDEVWKTPPTFFNDKRRNTKGRLSTVIKLACMARETPLALLSSVNTAEDFESRHSLAPLRHAPFIPTRFLCLIPLLSPRRLLHPI